MCEGGGLRGIGLTGAVHTLAAAGYQFPRVAGSSAGAVVASMIAALQVAGEPLSRLDDLAASIDYTKFADPTLIGRVPLVGPALSLLMTDGCIKATIWRSCSPGCSGIWACGPSPICAPVNNPSSIRGRWWSPSDLSRRRLVRIPWDLESYGVNPDEFSVAHAVRASSAIPFAFQPVRVSGATWVDGGLLSNFPVELFDRSDGQGRWPTFGIRLTAQAGMPSTRTVRGPLSLAFAALETLISDQDSAYIDDPCTVRRTIFVPADSVLPLDFDLPEKEQKALYDRGVQAAQQFLETWNYTDYLIACRAAASPSPPV